MNTSSSLVREDRLTCFSLALLIGATLYGVFAGAIVTMYYDVVPNMGALEDSLGAPLLSLYLLAAFISLTHLPLAVTDIRYSLWKQAFIRMGAFIGPLVVFLGADGLIAHALQIGCELGLKFQASAFCSGILGFLIFDF